MKTNEQKNEDTSVSALAALPEPTLEAQLAQMTTERDSLAEIVVKRNDQLSAAKEEIKNLNEVIDRLEKNPLIFTLNNIDGGAPLTEASTAFAEVCAEARRLREPGKVSVVLAIKPLKSSEDAITIAAVIKTMPPKPEVKAGIFFADDDGGLTRENPKQRELEFRK